MLRNFTALAEADKAAAMAHHILHPISASRSLQLWRSAAHHFAMLKQLKTAEMNGIEATEILDLEKAIHAALSSLFTLPSPAQFRAAGGAGEGGEGHR